MSSMLSTLNVLSWLCPGASNISTSVDSFAVPSFMKFSSDVLSLIPHAPSIMALNTTRNRESFFMSLKGVGYPLISLRSSVYRFISEMVSFLPNCVGDKKNHLCSSLLSLSICSISCCMECIWEASAAFSTILREGAGNA